MRLKIDLDMGWDIRLVCKLAKSMIETSSKVYKSKTYNKIVHDLIYGNK